MASAISVTDITSETNETTARATADAIELYARVAREKAVQLASEPRDLAGVLIQSDPGHVDRLRRVDELALLCPASITFGE